NRSFEHNVRDLSVAALRRHYPFFFCHPKEAQPNQEWARTEAGHQHRVGPEELRHLFHWTTRDLLRWRIYRQHAWALRCSLRRLLPQSVKHGIKMAVLPSYRRRQKLLKSR